MGDELARRHFEAEDFSLFRSRLDEETQHLQSVFETDGFSTRGDIVGFELEVCLVDQAGHPAPCNKKLLQALDNPLVVPELAEFNVEFNGSPVALTGRVFSRLLDELRSTWRDCAEAATQADTRLISIGILPTTRQDLLNSSHMSDMVRYKALNDRIMGLRDGASLEIHIEGQEALSMRHDDVMLEAATTSFQIHLQCRPDRAVSDFNASLLASAPLVALSANSPFLFGKSLWAETRIPLFEQSIDLGSSYTDKNRVYFGSSFAQDTMFELFIENQQRHILLLPYVQSEPMMKFAHLRFQNGTIWRWNRPLIGFDYDGQPHLRIEQRTIPAGPTTIDCVANCAAFIGFVRGLVETYGDVQNEISFETAKANFYAAAEHGLDAQFTWFGNRQCSAQALLLEELLPLGRQALASVAVPKEEIERFYDILEARAQSGQNGSTWQRLWINNHGRDFAALTRAYADRQDVGEPVHTWDLT